MLKKRMKRIAEQGTRAVTDLGLITASITALNDEDLLDLADIFRDQPGGPLSRIALVEMTKRNISLT